MITLSSMKPQKLAMALGIGFALALVGCTTQATTEAPVNPTNTAISTQAPAPEIDASPTAANTVAPSPTVEASATPAPTETATPQPTQPDTATPTPTVLAAGATRVSDKDQMVQVYIPAGEFTMGMTDNEGKLTITGGRAYPEIPNFKLFLDGYWMDQFEVTNAQFKLCVADGGCTPPWPSEDFTYIGYHTDPKYDDYPVLWVTWFQAKDYCKWAGRQLPSEAEWEKAARGPEGLEYPWGNDPVDGTRANFCDVNCDRTISNPRFNDGYERTAPVGSFPAGASPYGVMDMAGNVWEWTRSLIAPYPYDPNDGRENLDTLGERAWRGGTWSNGYWYLRSSTRYRSVTTYRWYNLGFRCSASK